MNALNIISLQYKTGVFDMSYEVKLDPTSQTNLDNKREVFSPVNEMAKIYCKRYTDEEGKAHQLGAEINERQKQLSTISRLVSKINMLTNEKNELPISSSDLTEHLALARELGVEIPEESKQSLSSFERERLMQNLELFSQQLVDQNKSQTTLIDRIHQKLNMLLMVLNDIAKSWKDTINKAVQSLNK
jgi:hypothetical protein